MLLGSIQLGWFCRQSQHNKTCDTLDKCDKISTDRNDEDDDDDEEEEEENAALLVAISPAADALAVHALE